MKAVIQTFLGLSGLRLATCAPQTTAAKGDGFNVETCTVNPKAVVVKHGLTSGKLTLSSSELLSFITGGALASSGKKNPNPSPPAKWNGPGSGPYPAQMVKDASMPNHTIFVPKSPPPGAMPVIVWGEGGCMNIGDMFREFLTEIASHGYFIVASGKARIESSGITDLLGVTSKGKNSGGGSATAPPAEAAPPAPSKGATSAAVYVAGPPKAADADVLSKRRPQGKKDPKSTGGGLLAGLLGSSLGSGVLDSIFASGTFSVPQQMLDAIEWVHSGKAAKYGTLEQNKVMAAGQSCGGMEAYVTAASDKRVKAATIFNVGWFDTDQRCLLNKLDMPIAWFLGGPSDLGDKLGRADYESIPKTTKAVLGSLPTGHMGEYGRAKGGRSGTAALNYFNWIMKNDTQAKALFVNPAPGSKLLQDGWTLTSKNWA